MLTSSQAKGFANAKKPGELSEKPGSQPR